MLCLDGLREILGDIGYKPNLNCGFHANCVGAGSYYLQHWQVIPDCTTGRCDEQRGRKYLISRHMCLSEVVQTALEAIKAFEEHEVRECFTYQGESPFGPHVDVGALMDAANHKDTREAPATDTHIFGRRGSGMASLP